MLILKAFINHKEIDELHIWNTEFVVIRKMEFGNIRY